MYAFFDFDIRDFYIHSTNVLLVSDSRNETNSQPPSPNLSLSEGSFIVCWVVIQNLL